MLINIVVKFSYQIHILNLLWKKDIPVANLLPDHLFAILLLQLLSSK